MKKHHELECFGGPMDGERMTVSTDLPVVRFLVPRPPLRVCEIKDGPLSPCLEEIATYRVCPADLPGTWRLVWSKML